MKEQLEKIKEEALRQIESSEALERLNDIRVSYLCLLYTSRCV